MAPPADLLAVAREMTEAEWQIHSYGHAVHVSTWPQANMPEAGISYNANADKRSSIAILNFLVELFEQTEP